ncbi:unnamed protein product [Vicia faba]|uniref:Uncharacterized protein n=1 Tax=Vicia faba TaxID=3906 RepID=A0AAV0ZFM5_VICFA|nr:unnamed protein product [Vicia faba]
MPGTCHLSFSRIVFDNYQLFSILISCPLIESLDLQYYYVRGLSPNVEKRCREQMKVFQLPIYNDYMDDYDGDGFAYMPFEKYDDDYLEMDYKFDITTWSHKGLRNSDQWCVTGCTYRNLNSLKYYPKF